MALTRLHFGNSFKARSDYGVCADTKAVANFNCFEFDELGDRENVGVTYDFTRLSR